MARRRKPGPWLFLCVLSSLILHLLLLTLGGEYAELHVGARASAAAPLRIRSIVREAAAPAVPQIAPESIEPSEIPVAEPAPPQAPAGEDTVAPETAPTDAASAAETPGSTEAAAPAPVAPPDDALYMPRRLLEQPPRLLSPVLLPWPEDGPPNGHYSEIISLFIDEDGSVRRVRIEGPGLPQYFQDRVQDAFLHARFTPGLFEGRAVKAWIRLEVRFDAEARVAPRGVRR